MAGAALVIVSTICAGCVPARRDLVLGQIGPSGVSSSGSTPSGSLIVYSAADPGIHFDALGYKNYCSDYKLQTADGRLIGTIHNDTDTALGGPRRLNLPPGQYRVIARANGYGNITVPVVIEPGKVTTLHLDEGLTNSSIAKQGRSIL